MNGMNLGKKAPQVRGIPRIVVAAEEKRGTDQHGAIKVPIKLGVRCVMLGAGGNDAVLLSMTRTGVRRRT
jgi:hypothetical protein